MVAVSGDTEDPSPAGRIALPRADAEAEHRTAIGASVRLALVVFIAYLAVAGVVLLTVIGGARWFVRDEWAFLTNRQGTDFSTYFSPWDSHWTTVPIAVYHTLFSVFGIRSYLPYLFVLVALHLSTVVLLRIIMRRAGVGPWIATITAGILVLFGAGHDDIMWAFQITFVGALVLGLLQLLGADHDGPIDGRDWLGLLAGTLGLMCSGVALAMVAVVGIAALTRRGWRAALFHVAPLAALYGLWYELARPTTSTLGWAPISQIVAWVARGTQATFGAIGYFAVVGVLLGVVLVVGLAVAWLPLDLSTFRRRATMPLALLLGLPLFFVSTAMARWFFGSEIAASSRYLYIGAALCLPAFAVAADALCQRWRVVTPVVIVMLVTGQPWNVTLFDGGAFNTAYTTFERQLMVAAARSPIADQVPADVKPDPNADPTGGLTIGWLRRLDQEGKLPSATPTDPIVTSQMPVRLGLAQLPDSAPDPAPGAGPSKCGTVGPVVVNPRRGDVIRLSSPVLITPNESNMPALRGLLLDPANGKRITVVLADLHLRISPVPPAKNMTICT